MDKSGDGWHAAPCPGQCQPCRPLQEDNSWSLNGVVWQVYNEDLAKVGLVMERESCKPTSAPQIPGQCSVKTACRKHWKQQGFAQSPRSMPGRRRRTRWGGGIPCWETSGQEPAYQVFSMGPAQHEQFHCLMVIRFINYEVPFIKLECPALEWVESTQAVMQQAVVASSPAPAPAEDFEEQTVEDSNQRWAAISTWEWTARECLGTQGCSSDHDSPDLKGQPVNTIFFQAAFQGDTQSCCKRQGNWGNRGPGVLWHVPAHE